MSVLRPPDGCREKDSNLRRHQPADLQSAPFGRSGIPASVVIGADSAADGILAATGRSQSRNPSRFTPLTFSRTGARPSNPVVHIFQPPDSLLDRRMGREQAPPATSPSTECLEGICNE